MAMSSKPKTRTSAKRSGSTKPAGKPKLSRLRRPDALPVDDWQVGLRRQYGRDQAFGVENLGSEPVFSEYAVSNPQTGGRYRVAIRGAGLGDNYCSCPDFTTNDLGTCKHIEYVLGTIEKRRGGKATLAAGFHPVYSEIYLHYAGARAVRFRAGEFCPPTLLSRAKALFDANQGWVLSQERFPKLDAFLCAARDAGHEVRCYEDALAYIAALRDAEERGRLLDKAYPDGAASKKLKGLLKTALYPYQAEGALFAARSGRALIGDEMGLGKTVQAIAAAELLRRHCGAERILIVCPTSLKRQWQREIERFVDGESLVITGLRALRQQQYRDGARFKITNYEVLARDLDLIQHWSPDIVIVDEAQRIKNWNTIAARALKRIESPYAIVLTGTPLENRLEELVSIVQFVDRYRMGPTWRLLHEHQVRDAHGRVVGYRELDRLAATLAPVMLRRRKTEVLEQLPDRIDNTLFVAMTSQQRDHHDENGEIVGAIVRRWRRTGFLSDADQRRLTCCLQNMRMSCNSTFLLDHETDHGVKADELMTLLEELFEQPDAKAVVFSQWVRTHELIIRRLAAKGWGHVLFHGGVPGDKRAPLIDRFIEDPSCRLFLSTDAGGVGLNLQHAAATVINMDLPWNPAVLEQRIGRVYRLGQTRSVQVLNLVAQGTIEEGMLSVLAFKKSLFAGVLEGGEKEIFLHGTRLAKFMESVEEVTGSMGEQVAGEEPEGSGMVDTAADRPRVDAKPPTVGTADPGREVDGAPSRDPWRPLIEVGLNFLEGLAGSQEHGSPAPSLLETDSDTGRTYLKIPVPDPHTVQRFADALAVLLGAHGKR
jgi:superfamily II DNA or RNA helicase